MGIQLPEKYKENIDVSSEGHSRREISDTKSYITQLQGKNIGTS
jgi:hypothetical protein